MSDDKQSPFKLSDRDQWAWSLGYKQGQEEIDRLRAEVERRGEILKRCSDAFPAGFKSVLTWKQLEVMAKLKVEIESLQPKPETDEHA